MIKCVGVNSNGLHPQQFMDLFTQECMVIGRPINIAGNNYYIAAEVKDD